MMQTAEKTLRNRLERTVMDARDMAEVAARAAIERLGVGESKPSTHLSQDDERFGAINQPGEAHPISSPRIGKGLRACRRLRGFDFTLTCPLPPWQRDDRVA